MTTEINKFETEKELVFNTINKLNKLNNTDYYLNVYPLYDNNALAEANIYTQQIGISPRLFESHIGSGYARERKIYEKYSLTKNEFIKWIVAHEYAHVFHQEHQHTIKFFQQVEAIYLSLK